MASKEEKGHVKNVANARFLLTFIKLLPNYQPSNNLLELSNLESFKETCEAVLLEANKAIAPYSLAVNHRRSVFEPLSKKVTKLLKVYKATEGVDEALIADFMTIARLLKGYTKRKAIQNEGSDVSSVVIKKNHSAVHLSYDARTSNMDLLISLLQNTPNYSPNEPEYQIDYILQEKVNMLAATDSVNKASSILNQLRSERNDLFYLKRKNLIVVLTAAKNYVLSILDTESAQYKAVKKIAFRKIRG